MFVSAKISLSTLRVFADVTFITFGLSPSLNGSLDKQGWCKEEKKEDLRNIFSMVGKWLIFLGSVSFTAIVYAGP